MPVFLGRVAIAGHIANQLAIHLGSSIETEGDLDLFVLEVAVDGLGNTDDLHTSIVSLVVLSEDGSVGVAVVTTDDDHCCDFELAQDLKTSLKLLGLVEFGAA